MKTLIITLLLVVLTLSVVSADLDLETEGGRGYRCNSGATIIGGTITDANNNNAPVAGANVSVTCNQNELFAMTDASGHYSVQFDGTECTKDDLVTVQATKGDMSGENEDFVNDGQYTIGGGRKCGCVVNIGIVDVPLIPEFGLIVGSMTIVGALIALAVIRKQ